MLKYKSVSDKYEEWKNGDTVKWLVPDVIAHGANMIYALPEQGKSLLTLDLAVALATGGVWLSVYPVEQQTVIWIDEDSNSGASTNKRLFEDFGLTPEGLSHLKVYEHQGFVITNDSIRKQLIIDCLQIGCKVVFMDSLGTVSGDPTLGARGMMKVADAVREITQAGIGVIMLHHQSMRGNELVGSGAIKRGYDMIHQLERTGNIVHLRKRKGRDSEDFYGLDIEKTTDENGNVVLIATPVDDPDEIETDDSSGGANKRVILRERIVELLSDESEYNLTQIKTSLSIAGRNIDLLKMCLRELVDEQVLVPRKYGKATLFRQKDKVIEGQMDNDDNLSTCPDVPIVPIESVEESAKR